MACDIFTKEEYGSARRLDRVLLSRGVSGICLVRDFEHTQLPALSWERFSVVEYGILPKVTNVFDTVFDDRFVHGYKAMQSVMSKGYKKPVVALLSPEYLPNEKRVVGGMLAARYEKSVFSPLPIFLDWRLRKTRGDYCRNRSRKTECF